MEVQQNEIDYSSIVETLLSMFGEVLCKDAIVSIVESCGGELEQAANIIMNITTGEDGTPNQNQDTENNVSTQVKSNEVAEETSTTNLANIQPQVATTRNSDHTTYSGTIAYSQAISKGSSSGAIPKQIPKKPPDVKQESKEMEHILKLHRDGIRTLIIMRGAPGSGKSYLAKSIIDKIYSCLVPGYWSTHIFSADDYFLRGDKYCFERDGISEAHQWNQKRSYVAMSRGVSPVIIDNTNIETWEMEPYVREGVINGYIPILLEPNTPWAKKVGQLARRNIHNVPPHTLERMLNNFQPVTSEILLTKLGFNHYINKTPDIRRNIPELTSKQQKVSEQQKSVVVKIQQNEDNTEKEMSKLQIGKNFSNIISNEQTDEGNKTATEITTPEVTTEMTEIASNLSVYEEVEKHLEEAAKIENEWDNGENWDDNSGTNQLRDTRTKPKVMPQRKLRLEKHSPPEKLLSAMENVQDWTMFMPTWNEKSTSNSEQLLDEKPPVDKSTTGTSMEIGDTDLSNSKNPFKIITATPRDINEFIINYRSEKIPGKWMLDKSTSTVNEVMHTSRCKNEEKHFNEFRKLFKHIPRAALRDIFDKCHGDVNWAVDIVLSDMDQKQSDTQNEELLDSDIDEENCENYECDCIAAYNIIPDKNIVEEVKRDEPITPVVITQSPIAVKRKIKKDNNHSDAFAQLKQKIEQNFVISDDHYSKHTLGIRKFRHGELDELEEIVKITEGCSEVDVNEGNIPSTSNIPDYDINILATPSTSNIADETSDDETISTVDEVEKTITIDVTQDLMSQLDEHFGWKEMMYSNNISTKINVPMSMLNELNAIWIESLLFQIEENSKQIEIMVKQDEEFARQMVLKEAELLKTSDEPGIPNFKEIMDMDYALSLYHKDVAQWRNNEPNDLAAKLSRDKLKKLFPDLSEDSLFEILMAHDNNFKMTVEALLLSTGKSDVLLAHNGVSKFIMDNENEQREKLLKKDDKTLSESEWPSLPENEEINMDLVKKFREEAEKHLKFRNMSHQKAQELMRRGMTPAASFYSEIAAYHKVKYEQANSYAAASLMHLHAHSGNERNTVDLHFLHVKEAKESLDLFLDEHIQILRNTSGQKYQILFFITGRGLHSNGRPRIKPAVKKRLRQRGLYYNETNPGLISARVSATSVLAHELG